MYGVHWVAEEIVRGAESSVVYNGAARWLHYMQTLEPVQFHLLQRRRPVSRCGAAVKCRAALVWCSIIRELGPLAAVLRGMCTKYGSAPSQAVSTRSASQQGKHTSAGSQVMVQCHHGGCSDQNSDWQVELQWNCSQYAAVLRYPLSTLHRGHSV